MVSSLWYTHWELGAYWAPCAQSLRACFMRWEHDVDIYVPARDASEIMKRLEAQCGGEPASWSSEWCAVLEWKGHVERDGHTPCCGFGYKLYHRRTAVCELDVLVLGLSGAPYLHGKGYFWPPWNPMVAHPWHWLASRLSSTEYFVIPEDIQRGTLMLEADTRWCAAESQHSVREVWAWCGGVPLSFFHAEYLALHEFFPVQRLPFYDLQVNIPHNAWAVLNRTYGADCGHVAYLNEHGGIKVDLRTPEYAYLKTPATVQLLGVHGHRLN